MEHLITPKEAQSLGRPMSGKIDDTKINAYITEVEFMNIKPVLGESLYMALLKEGDANEDYQILLNGGTYEDTDGNPCSFTGLKTTIAYFVYAQNLMSGDIQATRFGVVIKEDDYSSHISSKERSDAYNNTLEVANYYLTECVRYCRAKGLIQNTKKTRPNTGGCTIRKIG